MLFARGKKRTGRKFIDIAWAQRINLFYLWPFMEIPAGPTFFGRRSLSAGVRRVVDYAQKQRGMEAWIMQSANRIGTSDCSTPSPRVRTLLGQRLPERHEPGRSAAVRAGAEVVRAFYKNVNNADAYCFIDSDPGAGHRAR